MAKNCLIIYVGYEKYAVDELYISRDTLNKVMQELHNKGALWLIIDDDKEYSGYIATVNEWVKCDDMD